MGFDYEAIRCISIHIAPLRSQDKGRVSLQAAADAWQGALQESRWLFYRTTNSGRQGQVCPQWPAAESTGIGTRRAYLTLEVGAVTSSAECAPHGSRSACDALGSRLIARGDDARAGETGAMAEILDGAGCR